MMSYFSVLCLHVEFSKVVTGCHRAGKSGSEMYLLF